MFVFFVALHSANIFVCFTLLLGCQAPLQGKLSQVRSKSGAKTSLNPNKATTGQRGLHFFLGGMLLVCCKNPGDKNPRHDGVKHGVVLVVGS